ncbi:hypothetical protein GE09DRAFT_1224650 [Coniochaeta sp. 2T2.1]|nr:hypothetical protein GE09DRAFT_1224650 [Coniochaeta sp. 2T2.1]
MAPSRKKAKAPKPKPKPAASTSAGTPAKPRKKAVRKSELERLQEFAVKWGVSPEKQRELDAAAEAAKKRKREQEEEETDDEEVQVVEVREVGPRRSARQQARIDEENAAQKATKAAAKPKPKAAMSAAKPAATKPKPKPKPKPAKRPHKVQITDAGASESEDEFPPVDELVAREQGKGNQNEMDYEEEEEGGGDADDGSARSVERPKKQKPKQKPKPTKPKVNNKKAKPAHLTNGTLAGPDRRHPPAFNMFEPQHGVEMWYSEDLLRYVGRREAYAEASAELATQLAASKQAWRDVVASQNWVVHTGSLRPGASIQLVKNQKLHAGDRDPRKDLRCPDELLQQPANDDGTATPGDRSFARVISLAKKFGTKQEKVMVNGAAEYRKANNYGPPSHAGSADNNHSPLAHLQSFEPLCRRVERYRSSIPGPQGGYGDIPEGGERENLKLHYEAFERLADKFRMGERRQRRVKAGLERDRPVVRVVKRKVYDATTPDSNLEEEVHSPLIIEGEDDEQHGDKPEEEDEAKEDEEDEDDY